MDLLNGAPMWCNMVLYIIGCIAMPEKTKLLPSTHALKTTRASVSFPRDLYETLEQIAKEKKVSVAWIVRDAAEKYVDEQWPLFEKIK
jgi:predicted DNA-binding ribbon-helix-helix protein